MISQVHIYSYDYVSRFRHAEKIMSLQIYRLIRLARRILSYENVINSITVKKINRSNIVNIVENGKLI